MGFNSVYQMLKELFPQVDARLLKAVAIEHAKDLDGAVESILTEVLPFTADKADAAIPAVRNNGKMAIKSPSSSSIGGSFSGNDAVDPRLLNDAHNDRDSCTSSFYDANDTKYLQNGNTSCEATIVEASYAEKLNISCESLISECSKNDCIQAYGEHERKASLLSGNYEDKSAGVKANKIDDALLTKHSEHLEVDVSLSNHLILNQNCVEDVLIFENHHEQQSLDNNVLNVLTSVTEPVTESQMFFSDADHKGMSSYVDADFTQESLVTDVGCTEEETSLSTIITHSGQICSVKLLKDIIQDAKNYKDVLFTATESVLRLIEDVELKEKESEQAKAAAFRGGLDILEKVEEIKKMLKHAKEANEMHAGEVYGEKSVLASEVRELQTRLLVLADEKDESLALVYEMRKKLELRLAAAEEERKAAEREMLEKQDFARGALAAQEIIMEKVVQESKLLQQEAEENAKLRDFLMEKGQVVDELQGEISVICQDVKTLKKKFDNCVDLSKSISIEQTSFRQASSTSSVKSIASDPAIGLIELPETPRRMSPTPPADGQTPKSNVGEDADASAANSHIELLDEDWELFDF